MEAIVQSGGSDSLIHALSFKVDSNSAQYVVNRREASFFASGDKFTGDTGVKVLRFNIGGNGFIDLSSLVLSVKCTNKIGDKPMKPLTSGAHNLIERMTIDVSGARAEDISNYGRLCEALSHCLPAEKRHNNSGLAWGVSAAGSVQQLDSGESQILLHHPLSGLCQQNKWIPLWALGNGGISISFHLAPGAKAFDTGSSYSQSYELSDCRILANIMEVDSELQSSYAEHVLAGKPLMIPFRSWINQVTSVNSTADFSVNVARSFTRLNSVLVTLHKEDTDNAKEVNNFYAPGEKTETMSGYLQIGSTRWPDNDTVGVSQFYYRLLNALGVWQSAAHTIDISRAQMMSHKCLMMWDTEKVPQAGFTCENVSTGAILTVNLKGVGVPSSESSSGNAIPDTYATRAYVSCFHDAVLEIRDTGAQIMM